MHDNRPPSKGGRFFSSVPPPAKISEWRKTMTLKKMRDYFAECLLCTIVFSLLTVVFAPWAFAGGASPTGNACFPYQQQTLIPSGLSQPPYVGSSGACGTFPVAPSCGPAKVKAFKSVPPNAAPQLAPIEIRDVGPIKPLIAYTVRLAGSIIAAPFRLVETVAPISGIVGGPSGKDLRPHPSVMCSPNAPLVPTFPVPRNSANQSSPYYGLQGGVRNPQLGSHNLLQPYPYRQNSVSSEENKFPQVEPQTLLGGIVKFPATVITQGRILGDLNSQPPSGHY